MFITNWRNISHVESVFITNWRNISHVESVFITNCRNVSHVGNVSFTILEECKSCWECVFHHIGGM